MNEERKFIVVDKLNPGMEVRVSDENLKVLEGIIADCGAISMQCPKCKEVFRPKNPGTHVCKK